MTQEINTQLADKTFYTSPTKKIHSTECRHYRSDKPGWQKIDFLLTAIDEGYQLCRICCPSQDEINALRQQATSSLADSSIETSSASTTEKNALDNTFVSETSETQSEAEKLPTPTDSPDSSADKPDSSADKIVAAEITSQKVEGDNQISEITAETKNDSTSQQKSSPSEEKQTTEVSQNESEEATSKTEAKSDENKQEEKTEAKSKKKKKKKKTQEKSDSDKEKAENKGDTKSDSKSDSESDKKQKKEKEKSDTPKEERKRYKVLPGNGCHQAIAEVQGILVPPAEKKGKFMLILSDGVQLEVLFRNPRIKWIAYNKDWLLGPHWFRGYPKMKDDKLVAFQIIAWDGNMPTNPRGWEVWEFTGYWTIQKTITIQRSMMLEEIRKLAKETGFIKKFKYTFTNSIDWVKSKKLWAGYVYKLICRREGERLKIQKVIPYACPRIKPLPPGRKPMDGKGKFKPKDGKEQDKNKNNYKDKSSEGKQSSTEAKTEQKT